MEEDSLGGEGLGQDVGQFVEAGAERDADPGPDDGGGQVVPGHLLPHARTDDRLLAYGHQRPADVVGVKALGEQPERLVSVFRHQHGTYALWYACVDER
ncbi:hypothetical protein R6V09_02645 [Streptomyces sp. W16]|uniref:hypothetical protein n=1 Tax=Streptomyces sp. W16 TaxID=3076631 RepID=UPI00295AA619|nr:hypothetical protein [Streptomyces sp. W16]MDV9169039.1 hypothetical protein [Streptomyces sp. W16]